MELPLYLTLLIALMAVLTISLVLEILLSAVIKIIPDLGLYKARRGLVFTVIIDIISIVLVALIILK